MALRSGYYGLKNATKKALETLAGQVSGMKIIKSFGDGLNLTSAGKLNLTAAATNKMGGVKVGSRLTITDGVLSVDNIEYSTTKFDTGKRWVDGSVIYGIILNNDNPTTSGTGSNVKTTSFDITALNVAKILSIEGVVNVKNPSEDVDMTLPHCDCGGGGVWDLGISAFTTTEITVRAGGNWTSFNSVTLMVEYIEESEE